MDRRGFLKIGSAGVAAGALGLKPAAARGVSRAARREARAKNLIFMVSDGMSAGTLTLAEMASRHRFERQTRWIKLFDRIGVRRTLQGTGAADSLVTDSAAGAAAWGCGHKINNGTLNITPDGVQRLPLLVQAKQAGKATGVVSTARITHATPAGFYANVPQRSMEDEIARQLLERGIDVALGGGARHFRKELLAEHPGLAVARTGAELDVIVKDGSRKVSRLLGIFAQAHLPFTNDQEADAKEGKAGDVPTLARLARVAADRLDAKGTGFVLQVEGARVDHAAHNNDAGTLISEQLAFDEALGEMLAWMEGRDDTLLVVTTDHGNANPGMTVYDGASYRAMENLGKVSRSFDWIVDQMGKDSVEVRCARLHEAIKVATGVDLSAADMEFVKRTISSQRVAPFDGLNLPSSVLGGLLANTLGVGFVSGHHTSDMVELTSIGPGSELFPGHLENHQVHGVLLEALEIADGTLLPGMDVIVKPRAKDPND